MTGFNLPLFILFIFITIIITVFFLFWTGFPDWLAILLAPVISYSFLFLLFQLPSLFEQRRKTCSPILKEKIKHKNNIELGFSSKPDGIVCPNCKSSDIAEILYGLPTISRALKKAIEEKKVSLGGCLIYAGAPQWVCNKCSFKFGEIQSNKEAR